jgi:hypothetical protein
VDEQNNKSTQFSSKFYETAFRKQHTWLKFDWITVLRVCVACGVVHKIKYSILKIISHLPCLMTNTKWIVTFQKARKFVTGINSETESGVVFKFLL